MIVRSISGRRAEFSLDSVPSAYYLAYYSAHSVQFTDDVLMGCQTTENLGFALPQMRGVSDLFSVRIAG